MARLGINIDHVATLRQQRDEGYPSLAEAGRICLENGADQITIHLREDRRHIQDTDVSTIKLVTQKFSKPLNLEMGCASEIVDIAIETKPDWICLVPEKREEKTTEGGLNLLDTHQLEKVAATIKRLREAIPETKISLFVEAREEVLEKCIALGCDAVEIHTGEYARAYLEGNDISKYLEQFAIGHSLIKAQNIGYHAGHGITDKSLAPLVEQNLFEEYNIGHWVICQSLFDSLGNVVKRLKELTPN